MHIVFVSNFLNHHQLSFCNNLLQNCDKFHFVATESTSNIGYQTATETDFVVHWFKENEKALAEQYILTADIVIFGNCPNILIELRMNENKLSLLFSERFFKKGVWRRFIPQTREKIVNRIIKHKDKNIYILCASAYLTLDLSLLGFPCNKCFKWGYFPDFNKYENIDQIILNKNKNSILWVGRLIPLKQPFSIITVAKKLKKSGYDFQLNVIGDGPLKTKLEKAILKNNLENEVHLLGSLSPVEVREYMEKSEIFFFTSNRKEGWGAVLNESMNSACAVVSNSIIGSTPFLIDNEKTGLIFRNNNIEELFNKIKYLLDNPHEKREIQKNAYLSIAEEWNVETSTLRLINIINDLSEKGDSLRYECGPCSKANVIKERWR